MLKRVVHPPAAVLTDKEWNHDYVKLSVNWNFGKFQLFTQTLKLHYVHTGARNKPLMLFLHGFPEFWYSWRHQLREFSKDYWCVAIDMRGYNLSDKPKGIGAYRTTALAQDVREVIEAFGWCFYCIFRLHRFYVFSSG
jgi:pimeloyl-ACP methyl ester carboxylesterase